MGGCLKLINFRLILSNLVPLAVFLLIDASIWLETILKEKAIHSNASLLARRYYFISKRVTPGNAVPSQQQTI